MSGVCGWVGPGRGAVEDRILIEAMARPLQRFDGSALHTLLGDSGALALAADGDSAHVFRHDGVLVTIWGQLRLAGAATGVAADVGARLVALWRQGPDMLCHALGGAFVLCLVDERSGDALLAVDRLGSRPLAYQQDGQTLVFGSSADAIARHPRTAAVIDPQGLYDYVYFHMVPSPGSVHQHQQRLLPGHYLQLRQGRATLHQYWRLTFDESGQRPYAELKEEFKGLLRSSVADAIGTSRVGAFLSGGTDSSTLAGILCEVGGGPAQTYSIGFEAEGYDEMDYARIASRHFGTAHHEYYVTPDDVVSAIPKIAQVFDQPFGNASAVPTFYCAKLARADGLTRLFGGDGGDELFGGNERYSKQQVFARYQQLPQWLRAALEPAVYGTPFGQDSKLIRKARSYIEQASLPMPDRLETYNLLGRYGPTQVFTDDFLAQTDAGHPLAGLRRTYARGDAPSLINRMLALDFKVTLADNDLPKVAKGCELAGMEVAFPFLNDAMVAFSSRLTPRQKLNGTQLRYFFKKALSDFLPFEIITKQKHGFGLPFGVWLQHHQPLQQLARDSLADLKARRIVRADFIDKLLGQHLTEHAGYHGTMVWVLMMLEQWFKQREGSAKA